MDVSFVISATAIDATANFQTMKDIVKAAIDEYGTNRLRYNVIVFGNTPLLTLPFTQTFPTDLAFKNFVDKIPGASGRAVDKALDIARTTFDKDGRPDAKKVIDIIFCILTECCRIKHIYSVIIIIY